MPLNLTTALIALAVLVLVGIVVQGMWKARRIKANTARGGGLNVVVGDEPGERREPAMGGDEPAVADGDLPPAGPARADGRLSPARRSIRLDALIDAIATLGVDAPVAGERVLPHLPGANRVGTKPFFIEGLNSESGE